jgi:CDGSH-type Zn-finger protein
MGMRLLKEAMVDTQFLWSFIGLLIAIIFLNFGIGKKPAEQPKGQVNNKVKKDEAKVVDVVDCNEIEKLVQFKDGKVVLCRCWKSDTFPYCNGAHVQHNKETGDNVGPLIIKKEVLSLQ